MPLVSLYSGATAQAVGHLGRSGGQSSFSFTGNQVSWVVPNNVFSVRVDMAGAAGGGSSNTVNSGGGRAGHRVRANMPVTPGSTLYLRVGGAGRGSYVVYGDTELVFQFEGGWPGGGSTGNGSLPYPQARSAAGSGGGYSGIFTSSSVSQANAVIIAGGGGGRPALAWANGTAGGNATTSAGGTAGGTGATAGSALQGGTGSYYAYSGGTPGGGGGGGYFGGGGGWGPSPTYGAGAGGDGSSWTAASVTNAIHDLNFQAGNGYITLTW